MYLPHLIPVLVVTILNIILGMLWYSPLLFGKAWADAYRFDMNNLKPTPWHYVGSMLVSLLTVFIVGVLIKLFLIFGWKQGMLLGFLLWLGLIVTSHFSGVIWARKPLLVYFIDIGYQFVSLLMISTILSVWN